MSVAADLGAPIAYPALRDGTPVYDPEGRRVGVVERVLATGGIFEGVLIHTHPLPGRHVVADSRQISEIRERGVVLSVPRQSLQAVPRPARRRRRETLGNALEAWVRRAWDRITGQP